MKESAPDKWSVGHGTLKGKKTHFSINRAFDEMIERKKCLYEADFVIDIVEMNESGLPGSDSELAELRKIEDWFVAELEGSGIAVLALIVTKDGKRDFVFYTDAPDKVVGFFEDRVKPAAKRAIELTLEQNDWQLYRLFANADTGSE